MKLKLFIDRPILACVVSVLILLVGLIGLVNLPMEQYPDIAPPTVMVSATYTGANAETVQKSVVVPLEEAINGVEDMLYMTSTSTNTGSGSIMVYFKQGTDPDMATINTKNRVSEAEGLLPTEVTKIGVTVEKRQSSMLKIIALYSPDDSYDQTFINNYFKINIEPRLSRVSGVGNVNVMGGDYAMRIWLDPQRMAQYNLVPDDVAAVLDEQNVEAATGTLGEDSENTFQYTLKYRGRYETAEEFGNIVVKAFNALTTCPALCALIMTPHMDKKTGEKLSFSSRFHHAFEAAFNQLVYQYKGGVKWFFRRKWLIGVGIAAAVALLVVLMRSTKTRLVPDEDMGTVFVNVTTPPGSSLHQTIKAMEEVEACIKDIPQIERYSNVSGYSMMGGQAPSGGMLIIKLKNWSERPDDEDYITSVISEIYRRTANVHSAKLFAFAQPTIMGYSTGSGVELYVQDRAGGSIETLKEHTDKFIAALNARPEVQMAYTTFDTKFPQYLVEVDAARCKRMGVSPSDVLSVMSGYIGGNYASNLNRFSKLYRVYIQADKDFRLDKDALNNMFVRTDGGEMAPIGQFVTLTKAYGPETLTRFNLYSSIQVNAMMNDGYSSGDVINAVSEVAQETLPVGYGYEYAGITREEAGSGSNTVIVFAICIVFIYLILCALYESLFVPLAVMLSVPFGLMGSFALSRLCGLENNIYMQTGLIMLIGLLAKTAILVTEYAATRRRQGMTLAQAAVSAAAVRLRPILMTVLTMVFGMLPLVFSSGAGANGNISLGTGVVGGLLVGTLALLFVVPALFIVFQAMQERLMPDRKRDE